jgi:hypothetical protein
MSWFNGLLSNWALTNKKEVGVLTPILILANRQARAWGLPFLLIEFEAGDFFIFEGGGGVACATPLNKRGR